MATVTSVTDLVLVDVPGPDSRERLLVALIEPAGHNVAVRMAIELVSDHRDDDGDSLIQALRSHRELRGTELTPTVRPHDHDTMGGVVDGVIAVFGAGGVAVAIVQAVSAWLAAHRSEVTVRLTMDGKELEYSIKTHRDPREIIRLLRAGPEYIDDEKT